MLIEVPRDLEGEYNRGYKEVVMSDNYKDSLLKVKQLLEVVLVLAKTWTGFPIDQIQVNTVNGGIKTLRTIELRLNYPSNFV